jgi:hypothetical protein
MVALVVVVVVEEAAVVDGRGGGRGIEKQEQSSAQSGRWKRSERDGQD